MTHEISIEVTCYTVVGAGVGTVGSDIDFHDIVLTHVINLIGGHSDFGVQRQFDDACVGCSDTDFVLGTQHAFADHAAEFRAFDGKGFSVGRIEHTAHGGEDDFQTCRSIGRAANDLQKRHIGRVGNANATNVQVVAVGMGRTLHDFGGDEPFESTSHAISFFHSVGFETDGSESFGQAGGGEVEVHILFQPVVGYEHEENV